jgi:hypothetical protein
LHSWLKPRPLLIGPLLKVSTSYQLRLDGRGAGHLDRVRFCPKTEILTLLTTKSRCPKDLEPLAWDDGISRTICANQENGGETKKMHFSNSHLHEDLANLVIYSFSVRLMQHSLYSYSPFSAPSGSSTSTSSWLMYFFSTTIGLKLITASSSKLKKCLEFCLKTWRKSAVLKSYPHLPLR